MKHFILSAVALSSMALVATSALAEGTGSKGVFTIHNDTEINVVTGFYTNDGSGWSQNWLVEQVRPSEQAQAEFSDVSGSCEQTLQVGWLGEDGTEVLDEPIDINICDASNVYLSDNDVTYD